MIEIERKFLVVSENYKKNILSKHSIRQGYLCVEPKRSVRIRIVDEKGYITVKGSASKDELSRFEWEKEISKEDANRLILLCESNIIEKTRSLIEYKGSTFEVDEFHSNNNGLIIAEIELKNKNQYFEKPPWIGKEVTGVKKYYNSQLTQIPYSKW
jgi:CYTH domain-containing protein